MTNELLDHLRPAREIEDSAWALIPSRTNASTFIVLSEAGPCFAQGLAEKRAALEVAEREGCQVLLAWTGQGSTDLFRLDDLPRVAALVAPK